MFEGLPNGILPFSSARNHFGDFRKPVPHSQIVQTVVQIRLRDGEDDLIDTGGRLQDTQRMDDKRLTA
jgi:hypothetical protein